MAFGALGFVVALLLLGLTAAGVFRSARLYTPGLLMNLGGGALGALVLALWGAWDMRKASRGLGALRAWAERRGFRVDGHVARKNSAAGPVEVYLAVSPRGTRVLGAVVAAVGAERVARASFRDDFRDAARFERLLDEALAAAEAAAR